MSDFFKKFKSAFIIDDPKPTPQAQSASAQPPDSKAAPQQTPTNTPVRGSINDRFVEILTAALEKNNQEGFDYFEFRQALRNLAKMNMDEPTMYRSAYALAQTMGITPEKLVESARFYLGILSQEQNKFNEAHVQQRAKLIGNREEEIRNLELSAQQKAEQIQKLNAEIEESRQRSALLRAEIDENTLKIEATKADFEATFANVAANIEHDINNIQQYLTA